jgi:hypothetical protein
VFLYEPRAQLAYSQCAPFDFAFSITYEDSSNNIFSCPYQRIPASFNAPGFLDSTGFMHLQEEFLLDSTGSTFTISQRSYFRVHASDAAVLFKLFSKSGNTYSQISSAQGEIFAILESGTYLFNMSASGTGLCMTANLEIAIEPTTTPSACPSMGLLPGIGTIQAPYTYGPTPTSPTDRIFTAFKSANDPLLVVEYSVVVTSQTVLDATVGSNFARTALRLKLVLPNGNSEYGKFDYNGNRFISTLEPGNYVLRVERSPSSYQSASQYLPGCDRFTLHANAQLTGSSSQCISSADELPTTFNSPRWLDQDDNVNFFGLIRATNIPVQAWFYDDTQKIFFTVKSTSIIRSYVAPYDGVDVDLLLWNEDSQTLLASSLSFYEEETILYQVEPGIKYSLNLLFWGSSSQPTCPVFQFEVGIAPKSTNIPACTSNAERWPSLPKPVNFFQGQPYSYSSSDLYFEQFATVAKKVDYTITINSAASLYAELTSDFTFGDLNIKLTDKDTAEVFVPVSALDRSYLVLPSLGVGSYTLSIYQPVPDTYDISIGCAFFTFSLLITDRVGTQTYIPRNLPSSLNTVSYRGPLDFGGEFGMVSSSTSLTLFERSLIRVRTMIPSPGSSSHPLSTSVRLQTGGADFKTGSNEVLVVASPGSYVIGLVPPTTTGLSYEYVQVSVVSTSMLSSDVAKYGSKTCQTSSNVPISTDTNGYFHTYKLMSINTNDYSTQTQFHTSTFTLDRVTIAYFRIGYAFALGELDIELSSSTGDVYWGKKSLNIHEIYQVLTAGTYTITVFSQSAFDVLPVDLVSPLSICRTYSLTAVLRDAADGESRTDCSTASLFPPSLNDALLSPYGSVNKRGELFFSGDFLIQSQGSTTTLKVSQTSVLTMVRKDSWSSATTPTLSDTKGNIVDEIFSSPALYDSASSTTYELPTGTYTLTFAHESWWDEQCATFSLTMTMKPLAQLASELTCEAGSTGQLPSTQLGSVSTYYREAMIPAQTLSSASYTNKDGIFEYPVGFTLTADSIVRGSLSFNGLVNLFELKFDVTTRRFNYTIEADLESIPGSTQGLTATRVIDRYSQSANTNRFRIVHAPVSVPGLNKTNLCYPISWCFEVRCPRFSLFVARARARY